MEAGELQMRQAFEHVIRGNVKTVIAYSKETRDMVRDFEKKVLDLTNMVSMQNIQISELRQQLSVVQSVLYKGGTS